MFPIMGATNPTGYNLTRSLRFRASASAYLSRTFSGNGNQQTFTISAWVKRGSLTTTDPVIFSTNVDVNNFFVFYYKQSTQNLQILGYSGGSQVININTNAVFRDPSAWYHVVLSVDTTQATGANRVTIYVNNVSQSYTATVTPSQNLAALNSTSRRIGSDIGGDYFDGYMTEINFIDGQALTPSSFGSTNALTGVWQPARYAGTYGTNGFYLPFTDNSALTTSSNVGLGKDFSGNGNYWTTNNISITAGTTYDSMTDVPTLTSATAANFAVLNPLDVNSNITVSGGNLNAISDATAAWRSGAMTFGNFTTGKWYYEITANSIGVSTYISAGWELTSFNHTSQTSGVGAASGNNFGVLINTALRQTKVNSSVFSSDVNLNSNGDVLMIAVDFDAGKGWVGKNGTWYDSGNPSAGTNPCTTTVSGGMTPAFQAYNAGSLSFNAGQRPFSYTPPTGFVALNTYNLPTSTILQGNKVMDATLYTGNSSTQTVTNAGAFKPDLVWIKDRSSVSQHVWTDSVRGVDRQLFSSLTNAEQTSATGITSLNSNGFNLGVNVSPTGNTNGSPDNFVAWQWQAGQGSTSSNTNGTITSTVSVNASAGFSVVTFNGTGAAATVGHGLGVAPAFYIAKYRSGSAPNITGWACYHSALTSAAYRIDLNSTSGQISDTNAFNSTAPTSSVLSIGTNLSVSSTPMVVYAWTPIAGYSAFGSYTGNDSNDGPFVYLGFRPKFVMFKASSTTSAWIILDGVRDPYNVEQYGLAPNNSNAESTYSGLAQVDFLSNGFKIRANNTNIYWNNQSGSTIIYAAFAESPFRNSLAR